MAKTRIMELRIDLELVDPADAIVPTTRTDPAGATVVEITPIRVRDQQRTRLDFRVRFEPDNPDRREQPYRDCIAPVFPRGWQYGERPRR